MDGQIRDWSESPGPGEEPNCRCWAEPVKITVKSNCDKERKVYEEAQETVKDLTKKFNNLLIRLDKLIEENNRLVANAQKNLGVRLVAFLITLPFNKIGVLGELLQRYFESIISKELIIAAKDFMEQRWAVKQKAQYVSDQKDAVFAQLKRASNELEEAKQNLENCEKGNIQKK